MRLSKSNSYDRPHVEQKIVQLRLVYIAPNQNSYLIPLFMYRRRSRLYSLFQSERKSFTPLLSPHSGCCLCAFGFCAAFKKI